MKDTLIKDLCYYLGELDYTIEKSNDYQRIRDAEFKRRLIHELLNLPYKPKRNSIDYKKIINENKTIKEN